MPLLIIIGITLIIIKSAKPKRRPARKRLPSYTSPGPTQADLIKLRREQDRQQDRRRKQAEQDRKRREQEQKQLATATANQCKAENYLLLAEQYKRYINQLEQEKNDSNISLTRVNQIEKEILRSKEKIIKLTTEGDKAHYHAQAYFTNN